MHSPVQHVALVGLGLIGSSIARAVRAFLPEVRVSAFDLDEAVRTRAVALGLADAVVDRPSEAVAGADLVILCVPVGAMKAAAEAVAEGLEPGALVSDVGSSKAGVAAVLRRALPGARIVPAHPVAGSENEGPDAGFAELFAGRWCILTPGEDAEAGDVARLAAFWTALGARVEVMEAARHDLVLAATSHIPHLLAFAMVGAASALERETGGVITYSGGGFRDFTRIAGANPGMWRDIFLSNKDAVLDMLQRFNEDLAQIEGAIRRDDGDRLLELFTHARAVRRGMVEGELSR